MGGSNIGESLSLKAACFLEDHCGGLCAGEGRLTVLLIIVREKMGVCGVYVWPC